MHMAPIELPEINLNSATQIELEMIFSKYQLIPCIKEEFRNAGFIKIFEEHSMDVRFGLALMAQIALHKRLTVPAAVGLFRKYFMDSEKPSQDCADALLKAAKDDFIDWDDVSKTFVIKYDVSADVREKLDMFQYPLPMIEAPKKLTHNYQTGYQTIRGSALLRDNHHKEDICLDHLNRVNSVPLKINENVVAFVQNKWKNLDRPKEGETMQKYKKRVRAFQKYDQASRDVLAALLTQGNHMWLTHKYDFRGRTYAQGYHVNYQGNDWCKAVVELAEGEVLNEE